MSRYYYKKYLLNTKFNKNRKFFFKKIMNNYLIKNIISLYNFFNRYFNIILEEVYKMFYDLMFDIITNNYKKNFQFKKQDNVKKVNNLHQANKKKCDLLKKIKYNNNNDFDSIIDNALNEVLD
jgi:hypothetical protein